MDVLSIDMLIEFLARKKTEDEKSVRSDWSECHENTFCDEDMKNFYKLIRGLN